MFANVFVYDLVAILETCSSLAFAESADAGGRQKQRWQEQGYCNLNQVFLIITKSKNFSLS